MKTVAIAVVCLAMGALAGFAGSYFLLVNPAVETIRAERRQAAADLDQQVQQAKKATAAVQADFDHYRACVETRDAKLSKLLNRISGIAQATEELNPKAISDVSKALADLLDLPVTDELPKPARQQ